MRALEQIKSDFDSLTAVMPVNSWADVQKIVRAGFAPQRFPVGYEFEVARGNDTITFVVRGHDSIAANKSWMKHSLILEAKIIWIKAQFDAPEALYYAENGLAAGSYWFKWDISSGLEEANWKFTIQNEVPQGGQITLNATGLSITTYAADKTTAIETARIEKGSSGAPLGNGGVMGAGNLNNANRVLNGSNNYAQSAVRQLLNSNQTAGNVWTASAKFDRPPTLSSMLNQDGFKRGLDADFLAAVQPARISCITNSIYETEYTPGEAYEINNDADEFFIFSRAEIVGSGEDGVQLKGYKGLSSSERIKYDSDTNAVTCMLRTPKSDSATTVYYIGTSGLTSAGNAKTSFGVCPACIIA